MPKPLSPTTIQFVKATVPALEAHGAEITRRMYERLFEDTGIRELFNQSHHGETGSQPAALANAILAYARNIENPAVLSGAIERIAQKHVTLGIRPEHYPFVERALIAAIQDILGAAATPEICAAWGEAYRFLAAVLIGREAVIYHDVAEQPGGWSGWRDFTVERTIDESEIIRSFMLRPADNLAISRHKPGQYLGFLFDVPGHGALRRNYSISCAPNDRAYRISVKREATPGVPPGIASNWLHDHAGPGTAIRVAPPAGDFFLEPNETSPVVLVSGGVGLTPMISMLEATAEAAPSRPVWFIHGALNGRVHAMGKEVRRLAAKAEGIRSHVFYAGPQAGDRRGIDYDDAGLINIDWLAEHTPLADATYFLCGPKPFLHMLVQGLIAKNVPSQRIRYEFFGPAEQITAT